MLVKVKNKIQIPEPIPFHLARRFAALTQPDKKAFLLQQSKAKSLTIKYTWQAWARDKQLWRIEAPEDWETWLHLAGRGFGKTRTGAEQTIEWALDDPEGHIALVGRTVADVRDVMVGGKSGILKCSPPWFRPEYIPSKRKLIWPNGCTATTYSADQPSQLRGPQHTKAWCLTGDTLVTMGDGSQKPLADVQTGDYVFTRKGAKRVAGNWLTKRNTGVYLLKTLDGRSIIGTAEHPVWVQGRGFVPISKLSKGMLLCVTPVLNGTAISGINDLGKITMSDASCSIGQYGSNPMALFQRDATYTTRMGTRQITDWKISNCLPMDNTVHGMSKKSLRHIGKEDVSTDKKPGRRIDLSDWSMSIFAPIVEKNIVAGPPIQGVIALPNVWKRFVPEPLQVNCASASIAQKSIRQRNECNATVHGNVTIMPVKSEQKHSKSKQSLVRSAISHSNQNAQMPVSVEENVLWLTTTSIVSVEKLAKRYDVYDIAVEDAHEFFANGILVHNCDELASWQYWDAYDQLQFGLRLGRKPQLIGTTTPRATQAIKDLIKELGTHITYGTTYENVANLAKKFVAGIERKYGGTRLGLQELLGRILDDNPGALWKRSNIDKLRVRYGDIPELKRVVVAVDPAVKAPDPVKAAKGELDESVAETGIVVVGLGVDDQGYVLADFSMQGKPLEWANKVNEAYSLYSADAVIGEVNNGGDLVESNIRVVNKNISYIPVRATRGKQLRAEPVSNLYQQGRVHHVGILPDLEDQLVNWIPGDKSPDRLDAVVWGITSLMVQEEETGGILMPTAEETETILSITEWAERAGDLDWNGY